VVQKGMHGGGGGGRVWVLKGNFAGLLWEVGSMMMELVVGSV
jgi:hypothetical protein